MNTRGNTVYLLLLLLFPLLYGCKGNSIHVDTVKKTVTDADGDGLVNFSIDGKKEFVQYTSPINSSKVPPCIYLLKPNPYYEVTVISKNKIEEPINFVFKPNPGEKYKLENHSNGDAGSASCEVIFDSLNNVTVIYPDTSRVHPGKQFN